MDLSCGLSYKSLCIVIEGLDTFFFNFRSYLYIKLSKTCKIQTRKKHYSVESNN